MAEKKRDDLKKTVGELNEEVTQLKIEHAREMGNAEANLSSVIMRLYETITNLHIDHAKEMANAAINMNNILTSLERNHTEVVEDLRLVHEDRISSLVKNHTMEMNAAKERHSDLYASVRATCELEKNKIFVEAAREAIGVRVNVTMSGGESDKGIELEVCVFICELIYIF